MGAASAAAASKVVGLGEAVGHVQAGDTVHVVCSHTRWSAAVRELVRQWWGRDPQWTLDMLSLSSLGTLFFRGGLVRRVVTGYSGDVFPNFTPNPRFGRAYLSGEVDVEHWSFLTFAQRLEAAARGLPALTTSSLVGSSMEDNSGFARVDTPFGPVGLVQAATPDVAIVHAAVADRQGNLALHPPLLEGVWGALAARRGVVATTELVVDDITPWSHLVVVPAHRTLAVAECPMGAHPGGLYGSFTPAEPYAEDVGFWAEVRDASRLDDEGFDEWIRHWVIEPEDHTAYLDRPGSGRRAPGPGRPGVLARGCLRPPARPRPTGQRLGTRSGPRRPGCRQSCAGNRGRRGAGRRRSGQPGDLARRRAGPGAGCSRRADRRARTPRLHPDTG